MESLLKIFDFFFFGEISPSSQMTTSSSILNSVLSLLLLLVPRRFRVNIENIDFRRFGVFWVVEWYWSRNGASETVDLMDVIDSSKSTGISEAAVELSKNQVLTRSVRVELEKRYVVTWWAILINNLLSVKNLSLLEGCLTWNKSIIPQTLPSKPFWVFEQKGITNRLLIPHLHPHYPNLGQKTVMIN